MITKEFIKERLETLINEGKTLLESIPTAYTVNAEHQDKNKIILFNKWKLSCLNFLRSSFGINHYFYELFRDSMKDFKQVYRLKGI